MALFEVFIPTTDPNGFNITARMRADSWIQALRNGLSRLGDTTDVRNIMCDIREDSIEVTEPATGRVFRIRELPETAASPAQAAAAPPPVVALPPPPVAVRPAPVVAAPIAKAVLTAPPPAARASSTAQTVVMGVPKPAAQGPGPQRFAGGFTEESVTEERPQPSQASIGRGRVEEKSLNDLIADLFDTAQRVYDEREVGGAAGYLLDLAMQHIPADAGAVFIADINRQDLYFAAARGPKANQAMKFRVPMGQGIVGFSAQTCLSLAVSDVQRDPRFYAKIAKATGYETRSILCAPAAKDGRVFGALELINKKNGSSFTGDEVTVLNYLAHEFAEYLVATGQTGD